MSRQTTQQVTRIREEKFVMTKEFHVAIKIAKDLKKSYRDRVDKLKRKLFVTTWKIMSRHNLEAEEHEKLVANRFGVATQYIPIAIRTRLLHQNSAAIIKVCRDKIQERAQRTSRDRRLHETTEANDKD